MDIDPSSAPHPMQTMQSPLPCRGPTDSDYEYHPGESTQNPVSASTQAVTAKTAPRTGAKPTAPPRLTTSTIFLRKGANFLQISADCTPADKHPTHSLEEERKLKAVIRGIPTDYPVDEIQADLSAAGFPALGAQTRRDGSPLSSRRPSRTEEAKNIFNLNMVCGLSGIRVEALHKKGGPGQCHCCQPGHAAANCHADAA
ncbi:hypothetical protein EVAR_75021_1 [Eumeta japonica]|uniref:Pre-C2HC domain-containing protein n=1 Tax=Eumeta variegata TaxID=151549 RepID=A0A4C1W3B6_EUMVA|nr:hypothetical protein EVAR_75021_1 [Eumeta japonica]